MTDRFENAVRLAIHYPAVNTNRDEAEVGYPTPMSTQANFVILCANYPDEVELYRTILGHIAEIDLHEAREAFRVAPTYWAPFHPHHEDGMRRWGEPEADLRFGVA